MGEPDIRSELDGVDIDPLDDFVDRVRAEIVQLQNYAVRHLTRYRVARIIAIVSTVAIPVLTPVADVPRLMLGVLGGLAAATEAVNQLFRWRDSSIEAFQGANALEALLNLYVTSSGPYADDKVADEKFVVDVEAVRRDGYGGIVSLWSDTKTPSKSSDS